MVWPPAVLVWLRFENLVAARDAAWTAGRQQTWEQALVPLLAKGP